MMRLAPGAVRALAVLVVLLASLAVPRLARSAPAVHPEVERLSAELDRARGPEAYTLLRGLLGLWDVADPTQVEQALVAVADAAPSPAVRVYASLLVAEARTRRGDPDGASRRTVDLGYVDRWAFVGPFVDDNRTGIGVPYQPELELEEPIVPGRAFDGKLRPVRWRLPPGDRSGLVLDLGAYLRPREQVCGYATTVLRAKAGAKAPGKVTLWVGAEGAFKLWLNGALVLEERAYRGFDYDRFAATVDLAPGENRLTAKVCSDATSPKLALRVADERGAPLASVEATNELGAFERAATAAKARKKAPGAKVAAPARGAEGPVQAFGARTTVGKPRAADLEAHARYLVATNGGPIGEHQARDLATRAAEAEPSWRRALLAAELAEDRNQARAWVDKADALAGPSDRQGRVEVLVAKARLARLGIHWRDAIPFYEQALELDPDHVAANLGRTELYVQANLPRTALAVLGAAVARKPRTLALLRVHAAQLRALGRDAEADDVEGRWFAFRSDESSFVARQIDRAVARRDASSAERWLRRLERSEPDLVFAASVAARAYRSLGQQVKARQALERALDYAPEDQSTLRALADLAGEAGQRDEQIRQLRKILTLYPQAKDVRAYVEVLSPPKPRDDEAYAWDKAALLDLAKRPAGKDKTRVLRRAVVTTVYPNGLASRFHQVVWQPLTDEAAAQARQYLVQYEAAKQEIDLRLARVYRADGSVAEAIESGESAANDPSIAMYTSVRIFAVSFPRVAPGDVVELRYRIDDVAPHNEVADAYYDVELLQGRDPILSSELVFIAPKSRALRTFVANLSGVKQDVTEKGDQRVFRFEATDVPAVSVEPAMPPDGEVSGQVHVSTFTSWEELGRWYWGLARDQLDVDDEVRKKVKEIAGSLTDPADRVRAVYRFATQLRYVALEFGIEGIKPRRCALTIARGWGDCKDKATVIVTMLRELGIPATLVLVRTGMRGDLPVGAPPSLAVFDHAIAYVPSLDLYLDGTAEGSGSTELPAMDRGSVALLVNEGQAKLVRLPDAPPEASPHKRKIDVALAADGSASFVFDGTVQGVHASAWRARYVGQATQRERAARDLSTFFGPVVLGPDSASLVVRDAEEIERPFGLFAKGRAPTAARKEGASLSVAVAAPLDLVSTVASLSTRKTDLVVGGLTSSDEERTIRLPAGAKVQRLPAPVKVDTPYGRVELEVKEEPGKVTVKSRLAVKKPRIKPAEYAAFRDFCQKADDALGQRLVVGP